MIIALDSTKNAQARHSSDAFKHSSDAFKQSYDARKPMKLGWHHENARCTCRVFPYRTTGAPLETEHHARIAAPAALQSCLLEPGDAFAAAAINRLIQIKCRDSFLRFFWLN